MKRIKIKDVLSMAPQGQAITVMGWVRTFRNTQFISLNDGSTINNLQAVVALNSQDEGLLKRVTTGACLKIEGELIASPAKGQSVELSVKKLEILGDSDAEKFPLQPKKHSMEFLREIAHLRPRTNTFGAIMRVRHAMAFAVHKFFNERGFFYVHTPMITGSDAEGAGQMFKVTTFDLTNVPFINEKLNKSCKSYYKNLVEHISSNGLGSLRDEIEKSLKEIDKSFWFERIIEASPSQLNELASRRKEFKSVNLKFESLFKGLVETNFFEKSQLTGRPSLPVWLVNDVNPSRRGVSANRWHQSNFLRLSFYNFSFINKEIKSSRESKVDHSGDFFGRSTNLTVSGQLEGETYAMALGDIYTFGPTFRAENSNTTRHLAEFWMIEPEMAFYDLEDNMQLAQDFLQYLAKYALDNCIEDLQFLDKRAQEEEAAKPQEQRSELGLIDRLKFVTENDFQRLSYTEAIDVLRNSNPNKKKKFQYLIEEWGADLQSEHERYLVEKHFKKPVILYNYPTAIKSFYMKQNDDGKTVRAMDVLFPGIGEIIGGSQREENYDKILRRVNELGLPEKELWWYLELRKFGSAPHSGFGLGFERLIQFVTGMTNIRDVIPFPRFPGNAEF